VPQGFKPTRQHRDVRAGAPDLARIAHSGQEHPHAFTFLPARASASSTRVDISSTRWSRCSPPPEPLEPPASPGSRPPGPPGPAGIVFGACCNTYHSGETVQLGKTADDHGYPCRQVLEELEREDVPRELARNVGHEPDRQALDVGRELRSRLLAEQMDVRRRRRRAWSIWPLFRGPIRTICQDGSAWPSASSASRSRRKSCIRPRPDAGPGSRLDLRGWRDPGRARG